MSEDFLTASEAAKHLGVSKELMARYCRQGRLHECFQKGKTWLIPRGSFKKFQQIQKRYKPGRPRRRIISPIFWRERSIPHPSQALQILLSRNPRPIPRMIPRSVMHHLARQGRTRLERTVRQSLLEGLYDPPPKLSPKLDMVFKRLHGITDRIEPTDLYDLCLLHKTYPTEFKKVLEDLSQSLEASELIVQVQRCLDLTQGAGTKETLTKNERLWMESYIKKVIRDITLAVRAEEDAEDL